jgi:spore coat protein A
VLFFARRTHPLSEPSSSRRRFLKQTAALSLLYGSHRTLAHSQMAAMKPAAQIPNAPDSHAPMLHVLELPPFVDPLPTPGPLGTPSPHKLKITMREIHAQVHRDLPATRMWSYGPTPLGPIVEARSNHPLQIEWINHLPTQHFLPIDHSLHGCGRDIPDVRAVVHVHGAKAPSRDDGYPTDWFVSGKSRTCHYPLQQDAATLWYHDHAMGLNRLNTYAGMVGLFLIRDEAEAALNLPAGPYEVPLVLYDRNFTADGQLFYASSGIPNHPWVPEFTGDGILLNGKLRPFFDVEPRLYRFRVLNASNSRFFGLSLDNKQPLIQIGSDQGLLASPTGLKSLNLAPAERADLLIDFSQLAGHTLHLRTGALDILQFRVAKASSSAPSSGAPSSAATTPGAPFMQSHRMSGPSRASANLLPPPATGTTPQIPKTLRSIPRTPEASATRTRTITLDEYQDGIGNPMIMLLNRKHWHDPVTETPTLNTTEIWEFVNLTEDTHPMHLHLVRFQILDRRVFDTFAYQTAPHPRFRGPAQPPTANELGWKDVVQCPPGMITRIIARFEGYPGKYLYHCHVLEHEANDMMRPFEVIA